MRVLELSNHPGTTCHPSNGGELATSRCGAKFPSAEGWRALRDGVVTIIENNIPERYYTQMPTATGVARGVVQSTTGGGNTLSRACADNTLFHGTGLFKYVCTAAVAVSCIRRGVHNT